MKKAWLIGMLLGILLGILSSGYVIADEGCRTIVKDGRMMSVCCFGGVCTVFGDLGD